MPKGRSLLVILSAVLCCSFSALAGIRPDGSLQKRIEDLLQSRTSSRSVGQQKSITPNTPNLFESESSGSAVSSIEPAVLPSVSERFYEIACELAGSEYTTTSQAEQAILFLTAAKELGPMPERLGKIEPLLIRLACEHSQRGYSQQMYYWLDDYMNESANLEVVRKAISYLLDYCDTREQREKILEQFLANLDGKNSVVESELATLLGLIMVEKADFGAAESLFVRAYKNNKYNSSAFAKLVELSPEKVSPIMYFEHLRFMLRKNPFDIDAALSFAQYAESAQSGHVYEITAAAYQYCAELFSCLYPNEPLPANIYLPWIISNYNTEQNQSKCLEIAERIRGSGRFDILMEAIAGKAAAKIGDTEQANRILQAAEFKAQSAMADLSATRAEGGLGAKQLAWFYCFARQDALKALDWANKAYSTDPNSAVAASLLAYSLVMNQHLDWAKPLIENYEHNQIADLVQAQVQLAQGQKDAAIETLKSAISKDPASLAAERAKEILTQQGLEYVPPIHPDYVLITLRNSFGQPIVPEFMRPDEIISIRFNIGSGELPYSSEFASPGQIEIVNNSSEPLIISDDGLFNGNIRIDAAINGDLNKEIPKLVSRKIGSARSVEPGNSIVISVHLFTGELRQLLLSHPQASLNIEFTLYLDPIVTDQGEIINRLIDIKPVKVMVSRPGIDLSSSFLQSRFDSILTGRTGQKINIAELFVGLLREQQAMAEHGIIYRYKYADWMPDLLKSALLKESGLLLNPAEDEWVVKVHTMAEMLSGPGRFPGNLAPRALDRRSANLPLDSELMNAVAKNLNHSKWPVRMMAVYLLAKSSDRTFDKVLDWVAKNDSAWLVRDMSAALIAGFGEQE